MNFSKTYIYLTIIFLFSLIPCFNIRLSFAKTQVDSLLINNEIEQELYELNLRKYKRLLFKKELVLVDSAFKNELSNINKQFTNLAKQKRFTDANYILESAINLLSNWELESTNEDGLLNYGLDLENTPEIQSKFQCTRNLSFGGDLWRQEFEMSIPEYDSTITEDEGNPFTQLYLGLDYYNENFSLRLDGNYKHSRDYLAGELNINFDKKFLKKNEISFHNRLESTRYQQNIDLTYLQNEASADLNLKISKNLSVDLKDKFIIRKNSPQSYSYADYIQNQIMLNCIFSGGSIFFIGGNYEWENRSYDIYKEKDYQEHQFGINYYGIFTQKYNIHFDIKYRNRQYNNAINDTTFYNNYGEIYSNLSFTYKLNKRFSLNLKNFNEFRQYSQMNALTTDYLDFQIKPALVFYFKEFSSAELGYVNSFRIFKDPVNENNQIATSDDETSKTLYEEDYYSHGISFSIDIFQLNNFMLSLTNIYSIKRYPNSTANDISYFTLYTDRNINSILCFFSWSITKNWELGLIANYDTDHDPKKDNSDTRSTMLSIDLGFSF